eukprot:6841869-Prorocentrum_lima.AAC.1
MHVSSVLVADTQGRMYVKPGPPLVHLNFKEHLPKCLLDKPEATMPSNGGLLCRTQSVIRSGCDRMELPGATPCQ